MTLNTIAWSHDKTEPRQAANDNNDHGKAATTKNDMTNCHKAFLPYCGVLFRFLAGKLVDTWGLN